MYLDIQSSFHVKIYSHTPINCELFYNDISVPLHLKKEFVYISSTVTPRSKNNNLKITIRSEITGAIYFKIKIGKRIIFRSEVFDIPSEGTFITELDFTTGIRQFGDKISGRPEGEAFDEAVAYQPLALMDLKQHYDDSNELKETSVPIPVFYCTGRQPIYKDEKLSGFENKEGEGLHYGISTINIPLSKKRGELPRPKWWKCQWKENQEKHVMVLSLLDLDKPGFINALKDNVGLSATNDILVFIHGYNETFSSCVMRAAQIAYDINFTGSTAVFSWPSANMLLGYLVDTDSMLGVLSELAGYLKDLSSCVPTGKIHLIAHSMGNEPLSMALMKLKEGGFFKDYKFNQLILAAPDIDEKRFNKTTMEAAIFKDRNHINQTTLYASSRDIALIISQLVRLNRKRLGRMSKRFIQIEGIDLVDASKQCTDLLGHGYFSQTKPMIKDIRKIIKSGSRPEQRKLTARNMRGKEYWTFKKQTGA